jgi:hypothetical protein
MRQARWAVEGSDEADIEFEDLPFSNDEGVPTMCNFVCSSKGRHVHIDYCLCGEGKACVVGEAQHINTRITPDPERPKAIITHELYWRRTGMSGIHFLGIFQTKTLTSGFKGHRCLSLP